MTETETVVSDDDREPAVTRPPSDRDERAAARAAEFVDAARKLSELGWALIPVRGKTAGTGWDKAKPEQPANAAGKWSHWGRERNLAVVAGPSGLAVVDVDGEQGEQTLARVLQGEPLPDTPQVRTGRGRHLYFADPGGLGPRVGDGLDLRAGSSYVVAPPSIHPETGASYRWEGAPPWQLAPARMPDRLRQHFAAAASGKPAGKVGEQIPQGQRRQALLSLAGSLRRRGLAAGEILAALAAVNEQRCRPPLPRHELERLAGDVAARYEPDAQTALPSVAAVPAADAQPLSRAEVPAETPSPSAAPEFVSLAAFIASREEQAPALLGDDEDTFLNRGGLGITGGVGGSTKTTLAIDMVAHLAAGIPWLGIPVQRPLRVALIENEGSRPKFRDKLRQKVETWTGPPIADNVLVLNEPWTSFSFADPAHRRALREQCLDAGVELVVANPLGNLGVAGVGSPEETEAFMRHLRDCGLDRDLAFWLIHHFNRGGHRDILHKLSGAWDRHADTIIGVEREGTRRTKLTWAKTRWATPPEDKTTILDWHVPTRGFTLVETEHADQVQPADYEQRILDYLHEHPWATTNELHDGVEGRVTELRKARQRLETAGRVTRTPSHTVGHPGRADRWNLAPEAAYNPVPLPGTGQDGPPSNRVTSDEPRPPVPVPKGDGAGAGRGSGAGSDIDDAELERLAAKHADLLTGDERESARLEQLDSLIEDRDDFLHEPDWFGLTDETT